MTLRELPEFKKLVIFEKLVDRINQLEEERKPWVERYDALKIEKLTTPGGKLDADKEFVMRKADAKIIAANERCANDLLEIMLCWLMYT